MGVSRTVTVACDLKGCKQIPLTWNETDVNAGRTAAPEEAKYVVLLNVNGEPKSFCCQLHAAAHFLPPGYEMKQKQVIELPKPKPDGFATWDDDGGRQLDSD
jgi:hypothetical protein